MANKKQSGIVMTDFGELHFDNRENPRLPARLAGADDRDILNYMVLNVSLPDLMRSVGEKGFFGGEPLLVIPDKKKGGYTVVEGNRRLGAVRLLHNPGLSAVKKNSLRAVETFDESDECNL
ncbi:ParB N-terminal domain-containing protein [Desulfobacterales bacterium HSG2]|nr:ParB N-terminal domain-containing protein [Desulfobacterales bacterium HSG2]MDM8548547.1 ParB N-terminal domain-containing protein [Desulfobacterales bacterium HSG2]